ncbi:MAG: hypothetical protein HQL23_01140 [Candidatus Omnitrophica bacterium]|nr:hypothetical protein [Candidatus Omnitrophota bacterium]
MQSNWIRQMILAVFFLGTAFNITYWAIAKYDFKNDMKTAVTDASRYLKMSHGDFSGVERRYARRVMVPSLVLFLRNQFPVSRFIPGEYVDIAAKMDQLYFGIINILALAGTAFLLSRFCQQLGCSPLEGVIAGLIFLTSFFVVTYYTVPLVDALTAFCLMGCYYALLRRRLLWLSLFFLIGILTKEAIFLILFAIVLDQRKLCSAPLFVCLPWVIFYFGFFYTSAADAHDVTFFFSNLRQLLAGGLAAFRPFALIEALEVFMAVWFLAIYALRKCPVPDFIRRQQWILVFPFVFPFFVGEASLGRIAFYVFPIMIFLAVLALRDILESETGR